MSAACAPAEMSHVLRLCYCRSMELRARLATVPYLEESGAVRCDCFLLGGDSPTTPAALIQLATGPRVHHHPLPEWKAGDTLTLTPTISAFWNDVEETGRYCLELAIRVSCEGREGVLTGMVPVNPNSCDFTREEDL